MIPKTRLRVATDPKRGWQANKKCIYATAQTIRAMPEKEKPPAMRVDAYFEASVRGIGAADLFFKAFRGKVGEKGNRFRGAAFSCENSLNMIQFSYREMIFGFYE